ncbi:MAG: hypothetical protein M1829_003854 [Trizodia sp. TS-e1964]|nr:MAG: hypothetical protein M1829_003854 [Trizodia sp. TS-e1964]
MLSLLRLLALATALLPFLTTTSPVPLPEPTSSISPTLATIFAGFTAAKASRDQLTLTPLQKLTRAQLLLSYGKADAYTGFLLIEIPDEVVTQLDDYEAGPRIDRYGLFVFSQTGHVGMICLGGDFLQYVGRENLEGLVVEGWFYLDGVLGRATRNFDFVRDEMSRLPLWEQGRDEVLRRLKGQQGCVSLRRGDEAS